MNPHLVPEIAGLAAGLLTAISVYDRLKGVPEDQNSYQYGIHI